MNYTLLQTFSSDNGNQLVNVTRNNNSSCDLNGNLVSDGLLGHDNDCANELIRLTAANPWTVKYTYDASELRRIRQDYTWVSSQCRNANAVYYVYDGMQMLPERSVSNTPTVTYTRSHSDGTGNVTMLVDGSGNVLVKYLYCQDNPITGRDPSGHDDVDMMLDVLDIVGTLNTSVSAPSIGSVTGSGGPDVTKALKRTLLDVQAKFWSWNRDQRTAVAMRMRDLTGAVVRSGAGGRGGAADAWDIIPLMETGFQDSPPFYLSADGQQYAAGSGLWGRSVAFNGKCYFAGAVNYSLWGTMNRCVHDWLSFDPQVSEDGGGLGEGEYSLDNALHTVRAWKHFKYNDFGTTEREAEEFTAYGFNGTPPSSALPCKPSGAVVQAQMFNWCWEPVKPRQ